MGGDHGHHDPYKVPDYRIYKVENIPQLMKTQRALAAMGLKDPWLRNEVWRFEPKMWGLQRERFKLMFTRGLRVGFAAFVVTVIGTEIYDRLNPSPHGGHH